MKTICVVTSTRADYGLLRPLIEKLIHTEGFVTNIVATGMHLSQDFGATVNEIEADGFSVHKKIDVLSHYNTNLGMAREIGSTVNKFAEYFAESTPDLLVALGDRYEIMAVCCTASIFKIPIAHLYGGETTEGAVDEYFRHSITKMSALHFVSCEPYRKRVIQLGEHPDNVYNVGALGIENIMHAPLMSLTELSENIGFSLDERQYGVVTFHPVTLEDHTAAIQMQELISAMDQFPEMRYIITKANSDAGGREINKIWEEYASTRANCFLASSLGMKRYLSALQYAAAVIGNSSSGILEGPASKIPVVDIGDRQKGRIRMDSVIHCEPVCDDISDAMRKAFSERFQMLAQAAVNPYGDGNTSDRIVEILYDRLKRGINLKKKFYDIRFEV